MIDSIEWLRVFLANYPSFEYLIIFLAAVLGGELMLFVFGFLGAQGLISLIYLFPVILVGSFLPNALWFLLGGTDQVGKISSHRYTNTTVSSITEAVQRMSRGNYILALMIIKFLVGTPVLLTMYTSKVKLSSKQFLYGQSIATVASVSIIMSSGYLSGLGFSYITHVFQNLYATVGFILLIILIILSFQVWIEKLFTKDVKNIED